MAARDEAGPLGVVVTGGGARGAYEAGALSVLIPALRDAGERPEVYVGSSVGAINALGLAGGHELSGEEVARELIERWRGVTSRRVLGSIVFRQLPLTLLRYAGELARVPGVRLQALLDPRPLEASLEEWVDWDLLHDNVASGRVLAAACVATRVRTGRTVIFAETPPGRDLPRETQARYLHARLAIQHVRASASIPFLFPATLVEEPPPARGWYLDGSTRARHPLRPALDLGARRLLVVSTSAPKLPDEPDEPPEDEPVDLGDGIANLFKAVLADPLVEDVRRLRRANELYATDAQRLDPVELERRYPFGHVPHMFVAPESPEEIGGVAAEIFRRRYSGIQGLRSPDTVFLDRVLGGGSPLQGELLSYVLFDTEYLEELMRLGRRDARRTLDAGGVQQLRRPASR